MPHARSTHHPRSASNKTNNPETSNSRPGKTENWKETIAVTSKTTPARPRTIRTLVFMLRVKYLFISFGPLPRKARCSGLYQAPTQNLPFCFLRFSLQLFSYVLQSICSAVQQVRMARVEPGEPCQMGRAGGSAPGGHCLLALRFAHWPGSVAPDRGGRAWAGAGPPDPTPPMAFSLKARQPHGPKASD